MHPFCISAAEFPSLASVPLLSVLSLQLGQFNKSVSEAPNELIFILDVP